jgi:hypothetical protein
VRHESGKGKGEEKMQITKKWLKEKSACAAGKEGLLKILKECAALSSSDPEVAHSKADDAEAYGKIYMWHA